MVRRLYPGDCFGEISLWMDIKRTATVTYALSSLSAACLSFPFLSFLCLSRLRAPPAERALALLCSEIASILRRRSLLWCRVADLLSNPSLSAAQVRGLLPALRAHPH